MLKERLITAIILIPIFLALLFYLPAIPFLIVTGLAALYGAWEWSHLMQIQNKSMRYYYVLGMAVIFIGVMFIPAANVFSLAFFFWLAATVLVFLYPKLSQCWSRGLIWRGIMGIFVLTPCWVSLNYIREQNGGVYGLLFLFVLIWGADSVAYFVGKAYGKTKLAPLVSPGKSVQGVIGAMVFAIIFPLAVVWSLGVPTSAWVCSVVVSIVTVIASIIGDLFESMLKRQAGLKDSGTLLPGHGGLLDRIDSLTAAAPIFVVTGIFLSDYLH